MLYNGSSQIMIFQRKNMAFNSILFVIIVHRIGFLLLAISSGVNVFLPMIFERETDVDFARSMYAKLLLVSRLGILLLFITGPFRLGYNIPQYIWVKLILVTILLLLFTVWRVTYDDKKYREKNVVRVVLIIITATVGLII